MREISLIRHGETVANAGGIWQGTTDSPLTDRGRDQVGRLADRFGTGAFDLVVTSDLGRAVETAGALGGGEQDERWRELHLGSWEGMSREEIASLEPDLEANLGSGLDIAFGGGEKVSDMITRLLAAFDDLASRLDEGQRAAVVGHGGSLLTLISVLLGVDTRGKVLRLTNTGVTTFRIADGTRQLAVFNDTTHLPGDPVRAEPGSTHVVLARHGRTVANAEGRWQGRTHGELTPDGLAQARALALRFPEVDALYTSPLARAVDTARVLLDGRRLEIGIEPGLEELSFGSWEMMTTDEIAATDPELLAELSAGSDIARGGDGETFGDLRERVGATVADLAARHRGGTLGVVSHGAATRALAAGILGLGFAERHRIALLDNTAMARVVYGARGPALAAWNLTPHLRN